MIQYFKAIHRRSAIFLIACGSLSSCVGDSYVILNTNAALFITGNMEDGNFGFDVCQNKLNDSSDLLGSNLRAQGFQKAVFFGSTPTYNLIELATNTNALGDDNADDISERARIISVYRETSDMVTSINRFGVPPIQFSIGDLVNIGVGGNWTNGANDVLNILVPNNTFWSFTIDRAYSANNSCNGATSNDPTTMGFYGNNSSVDSNLLPNEGGMTARCNTRRIVICVAR